MKFLFFPIVFLQSLIVISQNWSSVGNGIKGQVNAFAIHNDELYMAGRFTKDDGKPLFGVVKWDGAKIDTLPGTHIFGGAQIQAIASYKGDLYFGGSFGPNIQPVQVPFRSIAKWDGNSFQPLDWGCNFTVRKMTVYNDNLYVGGDLHFAGPLHVHGIASWDGENWADVDEGLYGYSSRVFDMTVMNDELYVVGDFRFTTLNTKSIAKWNDTAWSEVGIGGISRSVYTIGTFRNNLFAVVNDQSIASGVEIDLLGKWNGSHWSNEELDVYAPSQYIQNPDWNSAELKRIQEYNGQLYIGGTFNALNGESIKGIARFDGQTWNSVGTGIDSSGIVLDTSSNYIVYPAQTVQAMIEYKGELYVGGRFNMIGGLPARNIAKWKTDKPTLENSIQLFPNPTTNSLTVNSPFQIERWSVFDTSGRMIFDRGSREFQLSVDMEELGSGIYYLRLQSSVGVKTEKIVKL